MGWPFGGRYETYVGTAVQPVIDSEVLSDIPRTAGITAVLKGQSVSATIADGILGSFAHKVQRAMTYARDNYTHGLPNHTFMSDSIGVNEMIDVLETIEGEDISLIYHHFSELHQVHIGLQTLVNSYGYDQTTNEIATLSASEGYTCYLENVIGIINTDDVYNFEGGEVPTDDLYQSPSIGDLSIWGPNPNERYTPWVNPQEGTPNWELTDTQATSIYVHYAYDNNGTITREILDLGLAGYDLSKAYFHTKYVTDLLGNRDVKYFTYEYGAGTYPTVDATVQQSANEAEFLPVVFFRHDRANQATPALESTDDYKTSKKLLDKLGMDYQDIADQIHDTDNNPDVDKIEQAVLMFGVPIDSTEDVGKKYLYEFFHWLWLNDRQELQIINGVPVDPLQGGISASDISFFEAQLADRSISIKERDLDMKLNYGSVASTLYPGEIVAGANIGDVISSVTTGQENYTIWSTQIIDDQPTRVAANRTRDTLIYTFKKQIGTGIYREVIVSDISLFYFITGEYVRINSIEDTSQLLIPLNYNLVQDNFNSVFDRNRLYELSVHLVFNTSVTQKIPWYATSFFGNFLKLVAVVVTISSLGTALGPANAAYAAIYAATGIAAIAVIGAILSFVFLSEAFSFVFSFVAKELGAEVAAVVAVLALVYGSLGKGTFADNLFKFSTNLMNASNEQYSLDTAAYIQETEEFAAAAEEKWEELEELQKALETTPPFDPLELIGRVPMNVMGEPVEDFYGRTIHTGNIGTLNLDYISNYTDIALKLPTVRDTVEMIDNAY